MTITHSPSTSEVSSSNVSKRKAPYPRLAGWAAFFAPCAVLLHELGHWVGGYALGYDVLLDVGSVSGGAQLGEAPGSHVAFQAGAGPVISIALTLFALSFIRKDGNVYWALALVAVAPVRFLVVASSLVIDLIVAVLGGTRGVPNFDEYNTAAGLGVPAYPVFLGVVAFLLWAWWSVWKRLPKQRWLSLVMLIAGAAFGLILWFQVIGPPVVQLFR